MDKPAESKLEESPMIGDDSASRVFSVGIVGAGEIVSRTHLPVLTACEGVRIEYVADKNLQSAQSVARSYKLRPVAIAEDLDELPQTDVVLLAVPVTARRPYYELFAKRGTSVLAEKPLAACAADAEQLCRLYPDYSLACGFQRRTYGSVALAKLLVAEKWFGSLRSISVSEGAMTTKTGADSRFYDDAASGGGVLMDLGCHSLDVAMYISNASKAIPVKQRFVYDREVDREVEAHLTLITADGECDLDYFVSWLQPARNTVELHCENCVLSFSCRPSREIDIRDGKDRGGRAQAMERSVALPILTAKRGGSATVYQAFYLEWIAFLDGIRTRQASKLSGRSCLPTIRAVEDLYKAGKLNP
jgi:predicted dehydrogenase